MYTVIRLDSTGNLKTFSSVFSFLLIFYKYQIKTGLKNALHGDSLYKTTKLPGGY